MRVEAGVCPNCSEVVFRLGGIGLEKALELLRCVGIDVARVPKVEFWGSSLIPEDEGREEVQIVDADNPLLPDTRWHAALWLVPEWNGGGPAIVGHQHCQHQLFPTMLKIERVLRSRWEGYDGGSTDGYRAWKARHRTRSAVQRFIREMQEEG